MDHQFFLGFALGLVTSPLLVLLATMVVISDQRRNGGR
jgi:hypothetical protein